MFDVEGLKTAVDCREVMRSDLGEPTRKSGKTWQWQCPFHADGKTPSLTAYPDGWHCFGCGESGDVIGWVQKHHNLTFAEACQRLGAGDLPKAAGMPARLPMVHLPQPPSEDWQDAAVAVVLRCMEVLWSDAGAAALTWLRRRGLADDTIRDAWLGYQPLRQWAGPDGVGYARARGLALARGVTIPHLIDGRPWAVKVATMLPEQAHKYRLCKPAGATTALYGADSLAGHDIAVVCEGEFDALLCSQEVGDLVGVITFGSAGTHDLDAWLPWLVHLRRLLIATDADDAGDKAAAWWLASTKRARRLLPPGPDLVGAGGAKDITDAHLAGADLRAWVSEAMG
ncbi:MAG TPA: CHC2 zinc finger domain-containing protein [Burkholderiales bacterium]|nr:CHC2 zinc finger domain-containing protein [Burkholderiales bacterium]